MAGIKYESEGTVVGLMTAPVTINSKVRTSVSDTLSLRRKAWRGAAQRWEIQCTLTPITESDASDLFTRVVLADVTEPVYLEMPQLYKSPWRWTQASSLKVTTAAAAGDNSAVMRVVGKLHRGDFIQFSNHSKVYMVAENTSTDDERRVSIYPALVHSVPDNTVVRVNADVELKAVFSEDTAIGVTYNDGVRFAIEGVKFIEVW